tara:strand:+ start:753 stop:1157 length:405 start_codon:yes stop_codon:yes gene_type:complete
MNQQAIEIAELKQRDQDAMEMAIALEERFTAEAQQLDQANRDLTVALRKSQVELKKYRNLALLFGFGASYGDGEAHTNDEIVQYLDTLIEESRLFQCVDCMEWCHENDWDDDSGSFGIHRCETCEDLNREPEGR